MLIGALLALVVASIRAFQLKSPVIIAKDEDEPKLKQIIDSGEEAFILLYAAHLVEASC